MVSSKFSRSNHAFRVPDICKSKETDAGPPPEVYPPQIMTYTYDVDVAWFIYHYTFSGSRILQKDATMFGASWRWQDDPTPPTTGVRAEMIHNPTTGAWTSVLRYWEGAPLRLTGNNSGNLPGQPMPLDTSHFEIFFGGIWQPLHDGQVAS